MPVVTKIALAVVLAASIWRAFFGSPPPRPRGTLAPAAAAAGFLPYGGAFVAAYLRNGTVASALIVAGVEALCLAVWLSRGRDDRGGEDPPAPDDGPTLDWSEFDRARSRWSPRGPHDRTPTPV